MPESNDMCDRVHRDDRQCFRYQSKVGETETKGPSQCPTSALMAAAFYYCAIVSYHPTASEPAYPLATYISGVCKLLCSLTQLHSNVRQADLS